MGAVEDHSMTLYNKAVELKKDIAVADYIMRKFDAHEDYTGSKATATPGMIVNWAMRMQPLEVRAKAEALRELLQRYEETALEEHVQDMRDGFSGSDGSAGRAFNDRWTRFQNHLIGKENVEGLYGYLDTQCADMLKLAENMGKYQKACAEKLDENIAGLRDKYCEALVDAAWNEGKYGASLVTSIAEGVTLGSPMGGYGAAAGALVGFIKGFVAAAEAGAADYLGINTSSKGFRTSMQELDGGFEIITPSSYFDGSSGSGDDDYGESQWNPDGQDKDSNSLEGKP